MAPLGDRNQGPRLRSVRGAALGRCASHLRFWSIDVRARPSVFVGVVTQLDTHPPRLRLTSCGACSPSSSARLGHASPSHLGGGNSATCPSLSCSGSDRRPPLANRTSLASTCPRSAPGSPTHLSATSVRDRADVGEGEWQAAPGAPRVRGQSIRRISSMCTLSKSVGRGRRSVQDRSSASTRIRRCWAVAAAGRR